MIVKNDKLKKILKERGVIFKKIGEINEKLVELDKERKKLGYKMDALKDKTVKIIDDLDIKLDKYEVITRIFLNDKKECEIEIIDQLKEFTRPKTKKEIEEFKKQLDSQLNKK